MSRHLNLARDPVLFNGDIFIFVQALLLADFFYSTPKVAERVRLKGSLTGHRPSTPASRSQLGWHGGREDGVPPLEKQEKRKRLRGVREGRQ